ncbi:MAG: ATP-binding protein [Candidatus Omnitrophota bacterium]
MKQKKFTKTDSEMELVMEELRENPYHRFEAAFALMSILPFLAFLYLLAVRLFSLNIFVGDVGLILFVSLTLSLCGFFLGYREIRRSLNKVVFYAAKAKHSDQMKSKFVATVSHDLRNPLFVLEANVTDLNGGLFGVINEKQKGVLDVCQEVVERMVKLVNDLLDLYKIEAGLVTLNKKKCSLFAIMETQIKELEVMMERKNIKFSKEIQKQEQLSISVDEERIAQVINNILGNAIKFTSEGGSVEVRLYPTNGFIRFECKDSGENIPQEKLIKIFDKFERLDTDKKGSGLGLAISKDIIELHKGNIWAETIPGKGNRFVFVLPREEK